VSETAPSAPTLTTSDYLSEPLRVGDPDVCGSLAVFPVFGAAPVQPYVSFAQGREHGVVIKELESGASVNDIVIENPTPTPVLLFEGEEVLGAQQNRTFDLSVLVGAHSKLQIPVSCVEAGRWDGSRHSQPFSPAPQAAYAELRRKKARVIKQSLDHGGPARANQAEVWDEVAAKSARLNTVSSTGAAYDIYEQRRDSLAKFLDAVDLHEGQSGAMVAIGDRFVVLDWVSRPAVFTSLHAALVQGYGLDALEAEASDAPQTSDAEDFLRAIGNERTSERDGIGLGREVRFGSSCLIGSGLASGDELVQLSVHNGVGNEQTTSPNPGTRRIRRPSRRLR
jgi:hypothetical protein